ncbi:hypothetical protein Ddye_015961 [Dipteronia dyeriana]|uniref:Ubiquitin-like protease family profile domain-containing protein n=1 Tax=Dipteronia dyeriana TaxID=168575 RepID=A0AAD9U5Z8_9ROSI|nr:hypothetical protein Ddye_015961 [Dipteronia dyeriana]
MLIPFTGGILSNVIFAILGFVGGGVGPTLPKITNDKMQSYDVVLVDDIAIAFPTSFSFTTLIFSYAKAPSQLNAFDCGLFVSMFMDNNCLTLVQMKSFQSKCQRLLLARFLALLPSNTNLSALKQKANEHYKKLVAHNEMVPRVMKQRPPIRKLRSKAVSLTK